MLSQVCICALVQQRDIANGSVDLGKGGKAHSKHAPRGPAQPAAPSKEFDNAHAPPPPPDLRSLSPSTIEKHSGSSRIAIERRWSRRCGVNSHVSGVLIGGRQKVGSRPHKTRNDAKPD